MVRKNDEIKNETELKVLDKTFKIKSKYIDTVVGFPNSEKDNMEHNVFRVSVTRIFNDRDKITRSFKMYGSYADYEKGKDYQMEDDLKFNFRCFINDAIYGTMSFEDFCGEFGYDVDSRRAEKIWKLCKKTLNKTNDLGISESELYDIVNKLSEMGIE